MPVCVKNYKSKTGGKQKWKKIEVNDYEMEPNSNGQGMVLNEHEVLKDGFITFNSITLAATFINLPW